MVGYPDLLLECHLTFGDDEQGVIITSGRIGNLTLTRDQIIAAAGLDTVLDTEIYETHKQDDKGTYA